MLCYLFNGSLNVFVYQLYDIMMHWNNRNLHLVLCFDICYFIWWLVENCKWKLLLLVWNWNWYHWALLNCWVILCVKSFVSFLIIEMFSLRCIFYKYLLTSKLALWALFLRFVRVWSESIFCIVSSGGAKFDKLERHGVILFKF